MLTRIKTPTGIIGIVIAVVGIVVALLLPSFSSSYMMRVYNVTLITYLCVLSLYVLLGMCGQNSFAQAGLWGFGAYFAANMVLRLGMSPVLALLASIVGTALFAFLLGFAFFRLRQFYFTFASIGLMTILNGLFMNWTPVTGGAMGIGNIPNFSIFGFSADTEIRRYFVILIVCVISAICIHWLVRTRLGRSFMAIRDNEMAANSMGVNSLLTKSIAFAISGALCGAAGALYAFMAGYISFQNFTFHQSSMYLVMIMLGGTISPGGAVIGAFTISLMQEWFRPLQNYMMLIYGVGIMVLMIFQPEGIWGGGRAIYERIVEKRKASAGAKGDL